MQKHFQNSTVTRLLLGGKKMTGFVPLWGLGWHARLWENVIHPYHNETSPSLSAHMVITSIFVSVEFCSSDRWWPCSHGPAYWWQCVGKRDDLEWSRGHGSINPPPLRVAAVIASTTNGSVFPVRNNEYIFKKHKIILIWKKCII